MSDELEGFEELDGMLDALLAQVSPGRRKQLARHIARTLRRQNAARIKAQTEPDGSAFAPRKPDTHRPSFRLGEGLRRRIMRTQLRRKLFSKLGSTRYLRARWSADEASAGFDNPAVSRIASVHHFGLRDRVYRRGGLEADYPERKLLGLTAQDSDEFLDQILRHLSLDL